MSRRFGQVPLNLWRLPAFKALSDQGKVAVLFFWSGPHSTSAGVGVVPDGYAIVDLGWTKTEWQAARLEAEKAGFVKRDDTTETVLVQNYLASNRPVNARHRAAIISQIGSIDCPELRQMAECALAVVEKPQLPAPKESPLLISRYLNGGRPSS